MTLHICDKSERFVNFQMIFRPTTTVTNIIIDCDWKNQIDRQKARAMFTESSYNVLETVSIMFELITLIFILLMLYNI